VQAFSPGLTGNVALTKVRSFDVQELADGNVCANAFVETRTKKANTQNFKDCDKLASKFLINDSFNNE